MHRIYVYGTLKRGYGNYERLLEGRSTFIGEAISAPEFVMISLGGFPGIVRGGETPIHGEIFEVSDEVLARLDRLEGHPTWYERQPITVTLTDGTTAEVEGYVLPASYLTRGPHISTGIWGA